MVTGDEEYTAIHDRLNRVELATDEIFCEGELAARQWHAADRNQANVNMPAPAPGSGAIAVQQNAGGSTRPDEENQPPNNMGVGSVPRQEGKDKCKEPGFIDGQPPAKRLCVNHLGQRPSESEEEEGGTRSVA